MSNASSPQGWSWQQQAFATALLDPHAQAPGFLHTHSRADFAERFDIYRNNVHASLIDALLAAFPVTARLVSEQSFRVLARDYLRRELPRQAALHDYGAGLPAFLRAFDAATSPTYLPDVAMLELLWWQAHGAADATPLSIPALARTDAARLLSMRATLHPAMRLLASSHPVHGIWAAHQQPGEPLPPTQWTGECVLLTRPDAEVRLQTIDRATHAFLGSLGTGATLQRAGGLALDIDASFNLGATLLRTTGAGALLELHE